RSEKTNSFSRFRIAFRKSAFSLWRLQNLSPLTTPPYSKGFLVLRMMRYALCIAPRGVQGQAKAIGRTRPVTLVTEHAESMTYVRNSQSIRPQIPQMTRIL